MKVIKALLCFIFIYVTTINAFSQQISDVGISNLSIRPVRDVDEVDNVKSLMLKFMISDPDLLSYMYITVYTVGDEGNTVLMTKDCELSEDANGARIIVLDQMAYVISNNTVEIELDLNTALGEEVLYAELKGLDSSGKYTDEVITSGSLAVFYSN